MRLLPALTFAALAFSLPAFLAASPARGQSTTRATSPANSAISPSANQPQMMAPLGNSSLRSSTFSTSISSPQLSPYGRQTTAPQNSRRYQTTTQDAPSSRAARRQHAVTAPHISSHSQVLSPLSPSGQFLNQPADSFQQRVGQAYNVLDQIPSDVTRETGLDQMNRFVFRKNHSENTPLVP